jgi:hypothetical protein
MKILLLCLPRTRSSCMQDVLSKAYNLNNLQEPYNMVEVETKKKLFFHQHDVIWPLYKNRVLQITEEIHQQDNLIVKIFPDITTNYLSYINHAYKEDFKLEENEILDIDDFCKISQYDKIYVLTRNNITDLYCSYRYGLNFKKLQYLDTKYDKGLSNMRSKQKIILPYEDKFMALDILQYLIFQYHLKKIEEKNIEFIQLEYNDVPNYLQTNFSDIQTSYLETNFDYQSLIKNYHDIDSKLKYYEIKFKKTCNFL